AVADPVGHLGGRQRGATAEKWVINDFTALEVVQDRPAHQVDRLLRRMIEFVLAAAAHDELRGWRYPNGGILAGLTEPGSVRLPREPARLMLKPVKRSCQDRARFIPDDLLVVYEADAEQPIQYLAGES